MVDHHRRCTNCCTPLQHTTTGIAGVIYYSRAFDPLPRPASTKLAAQLAYANAKAGVWAMIFVFLGMQQMRGYHST